jgi:glycosyltransferase involved in cell wall biosynthesis
MQIDISIIIPFFNEEGSIFNLSAKLTEFIKKNPILKFEIILVNDGSIDDSIQKIKQTSFPLNTKLISLSQNFGSHAALRAGILNATGNYIAFIYADLQDPIENIIKMYNQIIIGYDIIWANRRSDKNSFIEKKFSHGYSILMQKYVNKKYPKKGFDIVMFNKKVQVELNKNIESNSSIFLQILNFGFKSDSIEYDKKERITGKSKWTISKKTKLLIDSFVGFSFAPIRFVSIVGIIFFAIGILWSIYIITRKMIWNDLLAGWPALTSVLLLGFGITNISLGIIAEYLWRTLDSSRKRPVFIIDEIVQLN